MQKDSLEYLNKKKFLNKILTIYGRKPALEAISNKDAKIYRVHLSESNKPAKILDEIIDIAKRRGADILYHSKSELSRISKNSKQDQGIAVDLLPKGFKGIDEALEKNTRVKTYIALDNVTNPQNVGMIIRSVCASPIDGIILPIKGCAKLDSLVIKASAGTIFKASIIRSQSLIRDLTSLQEQQFDIVALDVNTHTALAEYSSTRNHVYVLGNETDGISPEVKKICTHKVKIPMSNQVESLNVAVTASLIAFKGLI